MRNKENILQWAKDRNLLTPETALKQFIKTVEELGEVASALVKNNTEGIKDGIGDVLVTLIILAAQNNLDIEDCLEHAYNEIKNRKGVTLNGVFIKESDIRTGEDC